MLSYILLYYVLKSSDTITAPVPWPTYTRKRKPEKITEKTIYDKLLYRSNGGGKRVRI